MTVRAENLGEQGLERRRAGERAARLLRAPGSAPATDRRIDGGTVRGDLRTDGERELGRRGAVHEAAIRAANFVSAAVLLVLTAPLLLVIAVAIKLDSPGPVFYRQLRVGVDRRRDEGGSPEEDEGHRTGNLGGRPFVMYKFRTMRQGAEQETGPSWSNGEDHRVTRVGRFLRHHRLDELPQLWNVIRGDMAMVGPRPERPLFFQKLREVFDAYPKRQTVPPGITGWAQVNRDPDTSLSDVEHKLRYDLEYLQRRSLWFDFYIMLCTPVVMLRRELVADEDATGDDDGSSGKGET